MSNVESGDDWVVGKYEYVGFWARVGAALIDSVILLVLTLPILHVVYGAAYWDSTEFVQGAWDVLLNWVFPLVAILWFWHRLQATPGKLAIRAKIIDARDGGVPTTYQWVIRYLGYFVATIPLGLGLLWVAWDRRKQGWHDKMAKTVVVRALPPMIPGEPPESVG